MSICLARRQQRKPRRLRTCILLTNHSFFVNFILRLPFIHAPCAPKQHTRVTHLLLSPFRCDVVACSFVLLYESALVRVVGRRSVDSHQSSWSASWSEAKKNKPFAFVHDARGSVRVNPLSGTFFCSNSCVPVCMWRVAPPCHSGTNL